MNKRTLKLVVLIVVLGVLSFLSYKVVSKTQEKNAIANRIKTIPDFNLTALNDTEFKKENLKLNVPTVFLYFNSECDFCQHEAQSISEHIELLNEVQILFVSTENIATIKEFAQQYNLLNKQNITFLYDNTNYFYNSLGAKTIPTVLIYNKHQELLKRHKGQLTAKGILNVLKQ